MSEDLFIPKLGQTVDQVVLISWLVEDGARVNFGDPVLEVETDKAVFNVEANAKGHIHFGPYEIGETLPVLTVVATIGKADEGFSPSATRVGSEEPEVPEELAGAKPQGGGAPSVMAESAAETQSIAQRKVFASPRARKLAESKGVDLSLLTPSGGAGVRVVEQDVADYLQAAPKASPIAARLAQNVGLSLTEVHGSGPRGGITRRDVEAAIRERLASSSDVDRAQMPLAPYTDAPVIERQPLRGVRRLIFNRMGASVHETARVTLVTEADANNLVRVREQFKIETSGLWGFTPGYNDMIGLLLARALVDFPYMNARLSEDGQAIEILKDVNLGVAVDTDRGLVVPVIKQADQMNLKSFGEKFRELVERAVSGRPQPEDLQGGSFTMTNLGGFEVDAFTPVINLPEAAILGLGRIYDKVVPFAGDIQIRKRVTLSLVFDHRLVDGAPAARFLQAIKHAIESAGPTSWQIG